MNETVSLETREVRFLSVFDFDGTLTYRDSFVPFLRFAFGNRVFVRRMLRMAGPSLAYLCRRIDRDDLKARLIAPSSPMCPYMCWKSGRWPTRTASGKH